MTRKLTAVLLLVGGLTVVTAAQYLKCESNINGIISVDCGRPADACPGTCTMAMHAVSMTPAPPYGLPPFGLPPGSVGGICRMANIYNSCNSMTPNWIVNRFLFNMNCITTSSACQCNAAGPLTMVWTAALVADCF